MQEGGAVESSSSCWRSTTSTICSDRLLTLAPGHRAAPRSSPPANRSAYSASAITAKLHNDGEPAVSQTPCTVVCTWMLVNRGPVAFMGAQCHPEAGAVTGTPLPPLPSAATRSPQSDCCKSAPGWPRLNAGSGAQTCPCKEGMHTGHGHRGSGKGRAMVSSFHQISHRNPNRSNTTLRLQ